MEVDKKYETFRILEVVVWTVTVIILGYFLARRYTSSRSG